MSDVLDLHAQGFSTREIAERTGRTRNSVIGITWRAARGQLPSTRVMPTLGQMREAYERHGGILTHAAAELGVHRETLVNHGFRSKLHDKVNLTKDPDTHALIEAIDASGLTDSFIASEVDMATGTISNWRSGKRKPQKFLAQCVRTVLAQNAPGY